MDIAIETEGLRKRYGDNEALRGVDIRVPTGSVLGVLGPNGAGKTTMVRILATLLVADGGRAAICGLDVTTEAAAVRRKVGLTGQYAAVDERLTARENLTLFATLFHLGRQRARVRAGELLDRFGLAEAADRQVRTFSGGMRRRLDLAASLIGNPPVLFLDEPTTGLDPASRLELWEMVREQVRTGTTVMLTTQYLEEADQLADRVVVIDTGQVIADGTPEELKSKFGGDRLEVTVTSVDQAPAVVAALRPLFDTVPTVAANGRTVSVPVRHGMRDVALAGNSLHLAGLSVHEFALRQPSLDDVFLGLTGHAATDVSNDNTAPVSAENSGRISI